MILKIGEHNDLEIKIAKKILRHNSIPIIINRCKDNIISLINNTSCIIKDVIGSETIVDFIYKHILTSKTRSTHDILYNEYIKGGMENVVSVLDNYNTESYDSFVSELTMVKFGLHNDIIKTVKNIIRNNYPNGVSYKDDVINIVSSYVNITAFFFLLYRNGRTIYINFNNIGDAIITKNENIIIDASQNNDLEIDRLSLIRSGYTIIKSKSMRQVNIKK